MPNSAHVLLAAGGVVLITWYGLRRGKLEQGEPLARPRIASDPPVGARRAVEAEMLAERANEDFPGGRVCCEFCGSDYHAGVVYCSCGRMTVDADDLDDFSPAVALMEEPSSRDLVCIYVAPNGWKATLVRSFLESHDIPAAIQGNDSGGPYAFNFGTLNELRVYVPADYADDAKGLLRNGIGSEEAE